LVNRNRLAAQLIQELTQLLEAFPGRGFVAFQEAWNRLNGLAGRAVLIDQAGTWEEGECLSAGANGGLLVRTSAGIKTLLGGEVSLRLNPQGD
jgi:BirA family biotin operon repressor/biotin-[acetyl-CoA-carboxylase] ligase